MEMSISKKKPISQLELFEITCFVVVVGTIELNDFFKKCMICHKCTILHCLHLHGMENFVQKFGKATHE